MWTLQRNVCGRFKPLLYFCKPGRVIIVASCFALNWMFLPQAEARDNRVRVLYGLLVAQRIGFLCLVGKRVDLNRKPGSADCVAQNEGTVCFKDAHIRLRILGKASYPSM